MTNDVRKFAPAAARNRAAILDVLGPRLPSRGRLLEIASGSGEHTMRPNVKRAIDIDATTTFAPVTTADAVVSINMIHIAPWDAVVGLVRNAATVLTAGGL